MLFFIQTDRLIIYFNHESAIIIFHFHLIEKQLSVENIKITLCALLLYRLKISIDL